MRDLLSALAVEELRKQFDLKPSHLYWSTMSACYLKLGLFDTPTLRPPLGRKNLRQMLEVPTDVTP